MKFAKLAILNTATIPFAAARSSHDNYLGSGSGPVQHFIIRGKSEFQASRYSRRRKSEGCWNLPLKLLQRKPPAIEFRKLLLSPPTHHCRCRRSQSRWWRRNRPLRQWLDLVPFSSPRSILEIGRFSRVNYSSFQKEGKSTQETSHPRKRSCAAQTGVPSRYSLIFSAAQPCQGYHPSSSLNSWI